MTEDVERETDVAEVELVSQYGLSQSHLWMCFYVNRYSINNKILEKNVDMELNQQQIERFLKKIY